MNRHVIGMMVMAAVVMLAGQVASAGVVTFRDGLDGYAGTQDTWFAGRAHEVAGFPNNVDLQTATWGPSGADKQVLVGFNAVFSDEGGPIALGSLINSATLTMTVPAGSSASGGANKLHQMLLDWVETDGFTAAQWNDGEASTVGAIQTDDTEAASVAVADSSSYAVSGIIPSGTTLVFDVTSVVQNWSNGAGNFGFLFRTFGLGAPGANDTLQMNASEFADAATRPTLTIDFIPEPASMALLVFGGGMMIFRSRR